MKKLLILLTLVLMGASSYATHLMGGEITYKHLGNDEYEVTLIVYRDCSGVSVGTSQNVTFESASCGLNFSVPFPLITTIDVSQVCASQTTTCNGGTLPGTEQWIYRDTVTMVPCTDWQIYWSSGNRNPAITNLVSPNTTNLFIMATLDNVVGAHNNSPQYVAIPTPYVCTNQLMIFNHGASDADGDSLYYALAQPLTTPGPPGTTIPYTAGYTINDPIITSAGMNLIPTTGEMCFEPTIAQICVVSVVISEYRNNVLIGTQIREMQVVVNSSCSNTPPYAGGVSPACGATGGMVITTAGPSVSQVDSNSVEICPGDSLCFTVNFTDPDGDNVNVSTNVALSIPGANFTVLNNGTPNPTGIFCWIPTVQDSGINVLTVILEDDGCPISAAQYYTYDITVYDKPDAGPDQIICGPQTAQLLAQGGAGYVWTILSGDTTIANMSCTSCPNPVVDPDSTTTYLVTSSAPSACGTTDTVTIFVVPDFTFSTVLDTALCDYLSYQLGATILTGPAGAYSFYWSNGATLDNDSIQNPLATPLVTTTYIVEIESPDGCVKRIDSVTVTVTPPPTVTLVPGDTTVCQGESMQFDVSIAGVNDDFNGGFDVSMWSSVQGGATNAGCGSVSGDALYFSGATRELITTSLSTSSCTSIDFCLFIGNSSSGGGCENADAGEDVILSYSNNAGATWTTIQTFLQSDWDTNPNWQCFTVAIPVGAQTGATLFKWDQPVNSGGTNDVWALDDASVSCGGNSNYSYSWSPATNLSATNISNPMLVNAAATTTYTVTIVDTATGCSIDRFQTITVVPNYTLASTQTDTNICLGETVVFNTTPNPAGTYNYLWSPGSIMDNDTIANPTGTFTTPGTNMIIVHVDNGGGCEKEDTMYVNVSSGYSPNLTMTPDSAIICTNDSVQLDIDLGGGIPATCGPSPTTACSGASSQLTMGTASGANGTTSWPAPYGNWYRNAKHQFLFTAAELNAMGFVGGKITEIAWEITTINGTTTYNDYQIKMGCTSTSNLTTWESGLTPVFGSPLATHNINIATGWNTHVLDVAYEWDGVSNLVVEICYDNLGSSYTQNSITPWTTTSFTSSIWFRSDSQAACPSTTNTGTGNDRPITRFTSCPTTPDPNIYSYSWTPSLGLSDTTIKNPIATPSVPTMYYVTVTDTLGGCFDMDSVFVTQTSIAPPVLSDTSFCEGTSVSVNAGSGFVGYNWIPSGGAAQAGVFTAGGSYAVIVGTTTCSDTSNFITVTELPSPSPVILGDTAYCNADSTMLSVSPVYNSYLWSTGSTVDSTIAGVGTVTLTVDSGGCQGSTSVIITNTAPTTQILGQDSVCADSTTFLYTTGGPFDDYLWTPTGSVISTTTASPGVVSVTVTENGCTYTASSTVYTYPSPIADFIIDPAISGQAGSEIVFTDASTGASSWVWDFDVTNLGSYPSAGLGQGPFPFVYDNQGTYTITLTVTSDKGCVSTISKDYLIFTNIIIPNVITPNGDGMNDMLVFENLDPSIFSNHLEVYNRWGLKVYDKVDYANDWDGDNLSDGTYFFILVVDFATGQKTYNGSISILR